MVLPSLLSSTKYIIVNKDLIKILGLYEAIIIGELCAQYTYWESTNQLVENEYFYATREKIEKQTGINAHYQRAAMKVLEEKGILKSKRMGIPCKKYYKINEDSLIYYLKKAKLIEDSPVVHEVNDKEETGCMSSNTVPELQEENPVEINNNNINNKINNNEEHTHATQPLEEKKEYATMVTLTEKEHDDLVKNFGEYTASQLIEQLSLYKQAHGKSYDSDYAAILLWVTNRIREMEKEDAKYKEFKNKSNSKSNFNQREYPPGFFDGLYCNK